MRQQQFLDVVDRDEAERRFLAALGPVVPRKVVVALNRAHGRILANDVVAEIDVPVFDRSDVDGFAVQAADTFGSSEENPSSLRSIGEPLKPGMVSSIAVNPGSAMPLATGAMIPRGADAVLMIEDTQMEGDHLCVRRAVSPGGNITFAGADIARGEIVLRAGQSLSARETGVLASLGIAEVCVFDRPQVAILSTGDELVTPGGPLGAGQIFDSNSTVLADLVRELGGEPIPLRICRDDEGELDRAIQRALDADIVLLSGGTSKGEGDLSYRVVGRLGEPGIVVHGVALKPGKPLCLAVIERRLGKETRRVPVAVLPGFPSSAIFTFREFLAPVVLAMAGRTAAEEVVIKARLPMRINSARGRTEYTLVALTRFAESWTAYPLGKGSGSVTTFSQADGFLTIDRDDEYLDADSIVDVRLLTPDIRPADLTAIGSHCLGLDWLLSQLNRKGVRVKTITVGSFGGVQAIRRGEADLAGIHLFDESTEEYNRAFVPPNATLISGYQRTQGILFRHGDDRFQGKSVAAALANALVDTACRMVNRNRGSGTRVLIDQLLGENRPQGYSVDARSHHAVAAAIAQGRADWGMAIRPVAEMSNLGFIPHRPEQFDFLIPTDRMQRPPVVAFLELLDSPALAERLKQLGFTRTS